LKPALAAFAAAHIGGGGNLPVSLAVRLLPRVELLEWLRLLLCAGSLKKGCHPKLLLPVLKKTKDMAHHSLTQHQTSSWRQATAVLLLLASKAGGPLEKLFLHPTLLLLLLAAPAVTVWGRFAHDVLSDVMSCSVAAVKAVSEEGAAGGAGAACPWLLLLQLLLLLCLVLPLLLLLCRHDVQTAAL
jgi:hypothetical protein